MYDSDAIASSITRVIRDALHAVDVPAPGGLHPDRAHIRTIAIQQAATMESRRLQNVELRKERNRAVADRDAALDLAAQYARLAGIEDPSLDEALQYVASFREQWSKLDEHRLQLDGQRWATLNVATQLQELAAGKRRFDGDVTALAKAVGSALVKINTAQGGTTRAPQLFGPPAVPQANQAARYVEVDPETVETLVTAGGAL